MRAITVAEGVADVCADKQVVRLSNRQGLGCLEHGFRTIWEGNAELLRSDNLPNGGLHKVKNDASGKLEGSLKQQDGPDGAVGLEQRGAPAVKEVSSYSRWNDGCCPKPAPVSSCRDTTWDMKKGLQVCVAGATGTRLGRSAQALGQAMPHTLVFDAACYLGSRRRLQEFVLHSLQWCCLLQRERVSEEEFGGCTGGRWPRRCCTIGEKELGSTA